jgi:hypothetical protein
MDKVKIELIEWWKDDVCGNGCCGEHGTKLIVNGKEATDYFTADASDVRILLEALNIPYELKEIDELQEEAMKELEAYLEDKS